MGYQHRSSSLQTVLRLGLPKVLSLLSRTIIDRLSQRLNISVNVEARLLIRLLAHGKLHLLCYITHGSPLAV